MENDQFTQDRTSEMGTNVSDLGHKAHAAIDSVSAKTKDGVDAATQGIHDTVSRAASKVQDASASINAAKDAVVDKSADLVASLSKSVADSPLAAILGAFAVGYVLARVTGD